MRKHFFLLVMIVIVSLAVSGCTVSVSGPGPGASATPTSSPTGAEPNWGVQTKTSGCQAHDGLPDSACTPGDIIKTATKDVICKSGYAGSVRNVPESEKNKDYAEYGITSRLPGQY